MTRAASEFGIVPARVDAADAAQARSALDGEGAVVLTGLDSTVDAPTTAAAIMLGTRLRELYPLRTRRSSDGGPVHLHADSFDMVVDVAGVPTRQRAPDEDYVFLQCVAPAPDGGKSFAVDAYRFVDDCKTSSPELWEFLTGTDVDLYGEWAAIRGLSTTPRVSRHLEFTRTGRRIARRNDAATPLHRDPHTDHIKDMLERFRSTVRELETDLPRFPLAAKDVLVIDNYRCWHGREGHTGERLVRILTARSADAR